MRYVVLIVMIVLSIFIVGCTHNAPATNNNLDAASAANNQPLGDASDANMPPSPPPLPAEAPIN